MAAKRLHGLLWGSATWLICSQVLATSGFPVELAYTAPTDCPDQAFVVAHTSARVRHQPPAPIVATATITHEAEGYRLHLQVDGGKRQIVSKSCESLVQTLTVILALAIDPESSAPVVQPRGPSQAVEQPRTAAPRQGGPSTGGGSQSGSKRPTSKAVAGGEKPNDSSLKGEVPGAAWKLHPELALLTEYGMLPQVAFGPSLGIWVDRGDVSLAVFAEWLVPEWVQMPRTNQSQGGYISFLGGRIDLCLAHLQSRLLRTCAGVEAGDLMGKGEGLTKTQLGHGIWLAGTVGTAMRLRISRQVTADLQLGLAVPVKRPAFGFTGYDWRFEPHGWSLRLAMGLMWF